MAKIKDQQENKHLFEEMLQEGETLEDLLPKPLELGQKRHSLLERAARKIEQEESHTDALLSMFTEEDLPKDK